MPDWAREVRRRLGSLRIEPTREADIVDELTQHLDDRWRDLTARGVPPAEAMEQTLAEIDSGALARRLAPLRQAQAPTATTFGAFTGRLFADIWHDLRHAVRASRNQPAFTLTTILTLGLGIGVTAATFAVLYGVLLKPLPFRDPDRLVSLLHRLPDASATVLNQGPATWFAYLDHQRAFESIGAWESDEASISGAGDPERVDILAVTAGLLPTLGVTRPALGRLFTVEDDVPGAPSRVLLTHGFWERRFGGRDDVIGQSFRLDGTPAEVIGVLPSSFRFLDETPAILTPMRLDRGEAEAIVFTFQVIGRLRPNTTLAQAATDAAGVIPRFPPLYERLRLTPYVRPLVDDVIGDIGRTLWILMAAVGAVLLIASANVANLFLIRAEGRQQELAVRAALGASRARVARALVTESLGLALAGAAAGLLLANATVALLRRLAPPELPRVGEIGIDSVVVLTSIGVSTACGIGLALVTMAGVGGSSPGVLREGGRASSAGPTRSLIRSGLVVGQVALALTLLVVSGLMVRTFHAMRNVAPGFTSPEHVMTFRTTIPASVTPDAGRAATTFEAIADRLSRVPGVDRVGLSSSITMDGEDNGNPLDLLDFPRPPGEHGLGPLRRFKSIGPGYLEAMGIRLVAGRSITWDDIRERRPVILISATLAREYWADPADALGRRVRSGSDTPWREVIGVTDDERDDGLDRPATAIAYWPLLDPRYERRTIAFAVRSGRVGSPGFVEDLRQAVWSVDKSLPLAAVQTLEAIRSRSMARTAFAMTMLAIAGGAALVLGVVGIYGVIAYVATQRTREIGIRMALGAAGQQVRAMFLGHGLRLTLIGIALGVGLSAVITRGMAALLFGVAPTDPLTYLAVSVALAAVALVASYLPARRASRVDPVEALRADG